MSDNKKELEFLIKAAEQKTTDRQLSKQTTDRKRKCFFHKLSFQMIAQMCVDL